MGVNEGGGTDVFVAPPGTADVKLNVLTQPPRRAPLEPFRWCNQG